MRLYLVIAFLLSTQAWAKTQIVFTIEKEKCAAELCVPGNYARKTPVVLLSTETGESCSVKTGKKHLRPVANSEIPYLKKCMSNVSQFDLALLEMKDGKFKIRNSSPLSNDDLKPLALDFYKNIIFKNFVKSEKIYPEANKGAIPYTQADFKRIGLEGYNYELKGENIQVVRIKAFENENPGGFFARIRDHWSRVSTEFSFPDEIPVLFTLRNRIFVKTESTCQINCDSKKTEIYEFNGKNFRLITHQEYTKPDPVVRH